MATTIKLTYRFEDREEPFLTLSMADASHAWTEVPNIGDTVKLTLEGQEVAEYTGRVSDRQYIHDFARSELVVTPTGLSIKNANAKVHIAVILAR